jgi:ethanolamine ammonia-lyase small subunit
MANDIKKSEAAEAQGPSTRMSERLAALTDARVGLGRVGASMPTGEVLKFAYAHARARDAVHADFDSDSLSTGLSALGLQSFTGQSAASDRMTYLRRPDLGRRLGERDRAELSDLSVSRVDVAIAIADGLSATAVHVNALPFVAALVPLLKVTGLSIAPVALLRNARVAIGDEVGALLNARLVLVLIGERPGLSSADSLGAYLTYAPAVGRSDAERNCISNIREGGLVPRLAARKAAWLVGEALRRALTGVTLKEEETVLIEAPRTGA